MVRNRLPGIVLLLSLAAFPACNDSGTGPGTGAVNFGTLAGGTDKLIDTYVTGNAPILGSLAFFAQHIQDVLAAAAPGVTGTSASPAQTCIAPSLAGKVFDWNGAAYEATQDAGPPDGVRFLLWTVLAEGETNPPTEPIGYVEIVCASTLPTVDLTLTVVQGVVPVVELDMTGLYSTFPTINLDGFYASPNGATKLPIRDGLVNGGISLQTAVEFLVLPDLVAGYRVIEGPTGNTEVLFNAYEGVASPEWNLDVDITASIAGPSVQGTAIFRDELVACISGSLSNPIANDPQDVGCSVPDISVGSVSRADRTAMMEAYVDLRILYGYLRFLADLGLTAVAAPA